MNDKNNSFEMLCYDKKPPFTSFLPGLAGLHGCPLWSFYVNRGQAICSFGVHSKANAIMEFSPANLAYRRVYQDGFRTFLKKDGKVCELFAATDSQHINRTMCIEMNCLSIKEVNSEIGIETKVTYFVLPDEPFPALVRRVSVKNLLPEPCDIELLDGMGQLIPYGIENSGFKEVSNLMRSWAEVSWVSDSVPLFNTRSIPGDEAEVLESTAACFALCAGEDGNVVRPIIDTRVIFGDDESAAFPWNFKTNAVSELVNANEYPANRYPCVFFPFSAKLEDELSFTSYFGYASDVNILEKNNKRLCANDYVFKAEKRARDIALELTFPAKTKTASEALDNYFLQSYLDNVLRGGYPKVMGESDKKVIHLFARKHGDPERDYNFFTLSAEPYSQGNGNFRDVNQNRRNDVFFVPEAGEHNVTAFFSLISADGYNPLEVMGVRLSFANPSEAKVYLEKLGINTKIAEKRFTVGELFLAIKEGNQDADELMPKMLDMCTQHLEAKFGEGYWSDHFTYNLDLIESYAKVFPDKMQQVLYDEQKCSFFYSGVEVLPRSERYKLINGKLCQKNAIRKSGDKESWLKNSNGEIVKTSVFSKLLLLIATKFANLDAVGCGIEMEGGRPGWNDAMNGVPFFFGSGMSETFELKRLIDFVLSRKDYETVKLPAEACGLLKGLYGIQNITDTFAYWEASNNIKEAYRERLYKNGVNGFNSGAEALSLAEVYEIVNSFSQRVEKGISRAVELGCGIPPTYFCFEATGIKDGVMPTGFTCRPLPMFLEAPARMMKSLTNSADAKQLYDKVLNSECYDEVLKMYKTSVPLDGEGYGIGRIRAFTAGWLERESVFLHMSYKYLLALLSSGLYDEFYKEIETGLVPFMNPEVYGRSIYENCSFIATSKNPDPTVWGRGFVSRLSGSTAEVLSMRQAMFLGNKCFSVNANGELSLTFSPVLSAELFDENGEAMFVLFGKIPVTYINKKRKNTFGTDCVSAVSVTIKTDTEEVTFEGSSVKGKYAEMIRSGECVLQINVVLD